MTDRTLPRRRLTALALALLTALTLLGARAPDADAYHVGESRVHWSSNHYPMRLQIVDTTSDDFRRQLNIPIALDRWNYHDKVQWQRRWVTANHDSARKACNPIRGYIRICNYNYGSTGWAGDARLDIYRDTTLHSHIRGVVIRINDRYAGLASSRLRVLCHELGHSLGIAHHSTNTRSCMHANAPVDYPDWHDYSEVSSLYAHRHWGNTFTPY